MMAMPILA